MTTMSWDLRAWLEEQTMPQEMRKHTICSYKVYPNPFFTIPWNHPCPSTTTMQKKESTTHPRMSSNRRHPEKELFRRNPIPTPQQSTQMILLPKQLAGQQPAEESPTELQLHQCTPIYEQCPSTHGPQQRSHPQQLEGMRKWKLETKRGTTSQRKHICPRIQKLHRML